MSETQRDTPRDRIARACALRGDRAVVEGCVAMLAGHDADPEIVSALGGRHANRVIDRTTGEYWGRVWGARGLLYVFDDFAVPALRTASRDEHWRVREMVAKVVAKRRLDELASAVAPLRSDDVPRVRIAAERALLTIASPPRGSRGPQR